METIVSIFTSLFSILTDNKIVGVPILVWFIIALVLGLIIQYIKGKKE